MYTDIYWSLYIYATKICRFVNIGYNIIEHVKPWPALAVKDECRARREDWNSAGWARALWNLVGLEMKVLETKHITNAY